MVSMHLAILRSAESTHCLGMHYPLGATTSGVLMRPNLLYSCRSSRSVKITGVRNSHGAIFNSTSLVLRSTTALGETMSVWRERHSHTEPLHSQGSFSGPQTPPTPQNKPMIPSLSSPLSQS